MRNLTLLALILPLAGCWSGNSFYSPSEAVQAIPAGRYQVVHIRGPRSENDEESYGERIDISYKADGRAVIEGMEGGDSDNSLLVKLGDQPGLYVVQADLGARLPKLGSSLFALVNVIPDGYQLSVPKCDQKRAAFWNKAIVGGVLGGKLICKFTNRADFETAMLDYAKDPIGWTEYRLVKKRRKGGG
jgi:hypothetical protein